MMKSQLSVETLGRVWDLSDIDNDGCLDLQEFILAMHLIHRCVEGDMLPDSLPQSLVPPGKERFFSHFTFTPATADPFNTHTIPSTMALVPVPKSTWSDPMGLGDASQFSPLALTSPFAVAMHLTTEQLASSPYSRPLPAVLPPALVPPSLRPIPPDPAIFEESNKLIAEIETINRERAEVEAAYSTLNVEAQRRATETASVQRTVDALIHTARSLVNQRNEAERRLNDYAHERDTLASILHELKGHVASERQKVEEMRGQISSQQVSAKADVGGLSTDAVNEYLIASGSQFL
ncbi:unnamed protein product [Echinostoma caproni]|uniref:EF-hand domain-containing protein n=1 Tax=Echinostoma caproni TaxID=27848 RepID=A0A183AW99_9TREM|nr:unnamed protein product [Echinostoma caproni]